VVTSKAVVVPPAALIQSMIRCRCASCAATKFHGLEPRMLLTPGHGTACMAVMHSSQAGHQAPT
jgi:hypothetical protein